MRPTSRLGSLVAAGAGALLGLSVLGTAPAVASDDGFSITDIPSTPGLPIPSLPTDLLVPRFEGAPATARPIDHPAIPEHPHLAPNGRSSMHNDPYSSDAYDVTGPLGNDLEVSSRSYGIRECATIAFDSQDRIVGLCGGLEGFRMMVIDPETLAPIDERVISRRDFTSGANPFTDICGGTYFFLDKQDHAYATTTESGLTEVAVGEDGTLSPVRDWHLASHLPEGDCLVATSVGWDGTVWWFSQQGMVGTLDRASGEIHTLRLPEGEGIFNSVSADETGGTYVVTTHATYRLDLDAAGQPQISWREEYDRGSTAKPGMLSHGSGTSPTLIGNRWVVVADNAEPRSQILVYDRRRGRSDRLHCTVPVLQSGASTTENSLVAAGNSVIIENNYGYEGFQSTLLGATTTPGLSRVMIEDDGCHVAWTNDSVAPSSVPKASLGNGLVYAYTKPKKAGVDAWYVTAIDIHTGKTAWSRLTGTGPQWNNHYASIYLGPDGTLYLATIAGLMRVADGDRG